MQPHKFKSGKKVQCNSQEDLSHESNDIINKLFTINIQNLTLD